MKTPRVESRKTTLMRLVTKGLNRNERLIIILYYYEELTMKEIGATLDLSESRVSQMHSSIVAAVCSSSWDDVESNLAAITSGNVKHLELGSSSKLAKLFSVVPNFGDGLSFPCCATIEYSSMLSCRAIAMSNDSYDKILQKVRARRRRLNNNSGWEKRWPR